MSIAVRGDPVVEVGDTLRKHATGQVSGVLGIFTYDRVLDAQWSVSDPSVAQLTPVVPPPSDSTSTASAILRGLRPGTVRITARARGVEGHGSLRVIPVVAEIELRATRQVLAVGDTIDIGVAFLDRARTPIPDLPFQATATGAVRLHDRTSSRIRVIGTAAGPATVTVLFRRHEARVALTVEPR